MGAAAVPEQLLTPPAAGHSCSPAHCCFAFSLLPPQLSMAEDLLLGCSQLELSKMNSFRSSSYNALSPSGPTNITLNISDVIYFCIEFPQTSTSGKKSLCCSMLGDILNDLVPKCSFLVVILCHPTSCKVLVLAFMGQSNWSLDNFKLLM